MEVNIDFEQNGVQTYDHASSGRVEDFLRSMVVYQLRNMLDNELREYKAVRPQSSFADLDKYLQSIDCRQKAIEQSRAFFDQCFINLKTAYEQNEVKPTLTSISSAADGITQVSLKVSLITNNE